MRCPSEVSSRDRRQPMQGAFPVSQHRCQRPNAFPGTSGVGHCRLRNQTNKNREFPSTRAL